MIFIRSFEWHEHELDRIWREWNTTTTTATRIETNYKKIRKNPSRKRIDFFVPRHFYSVVLSDGRLVGFVLFGILSVRTVSVPPTHEFHLNFEIFYERLNIYLMSSNMYITSSKHSMNYSFYLGYLNRLNTLFLEYFNNYRELTRSAYILDLLTLKCDNWLDFLNKSNFWGLFSLFGMKWRSRSQ